MARHSTKNRSHGIDLLACEYFVDTDSLESLRQSAQNPQHFLITCDFATFTSMKIFKDRQAAGELLAARLKNIEADLILGIPRGGVVVAAAVAERLNLPLDIIVTRKIGAPAQEELALGAVDRDGQAVWDELLLGELELKIENLKLKINDGMEEIKRREHLYRQGKESLNVSNKAVILVDDGIATGATVLAAINFLRRHGVKKIIVAVPVASKEAMAKIARELGKVGDMVVLEIPEFFAAVGQFYQEFEAVTDEEVVQYLGSSSVRKKSLTL